MQEYVEWAARESGRRLEIRGARAEVATRNKFGTRERLFDVSDAAIGEILSTSDLRVVPSDDDLLIVQHSSD